MLLTRLILVFVAKECVFKTVGVKRSLEWKVMGRCIKG